MTIAKFALAALLGLQCAAYAQNRQPATPRGGLWSYHDQRSDGFQANQDLLHRFRDRGPSCGPERAESEWNSNSQSYRYVCVPESANGA
jgi:hypothetical protein